MKKLNVVLNKNLGKEATLSDKIGTIVGSISFIFLMWLFISWVEVITHNAPHQPEYTYSTINFFKVWFGL